MIQVIEHGTTYREAECPLCECRFSFGRADIEEIYDGIDVVRCPECGKIISAVYPKESVGKLIRNQLHDFKTIAKYENWVKKHEDEEIYAIVMADDFDEVLFDVTEDDFNEMVDAGIVNSEGSYYLLNNPTLEQIRQYAYRWGIKWTD